MRMSHQLIGCVGSRLWERAGTLTRWQDVHRRRVMEMMGSSDDGCRPWSFGGLFPYIVDASQSSVHGPSEPIHGRGVYGEARAVL